MAEIQVRKYKRAGLVKMRFYLGEPNRYGKGCSYLWVTKQFKETCGMEQCL